MNDIKETIQEFTDNFCEKIEYKNGDVELRLFDIEPENLIKWLIDTLINENKKYSEDRCFDCELGFSERISELEKHRDNI